jgi:2-iminobutanoate/2-iminopropanoate deaminase
MNKRVSIEVPGLQHDNPIPNACRIGPFLVSGGIAGKDPQNGRVPEGIESQCAHMFGNIRKIMETAGGTTDNILKVTVWLKDLSNRKQVNKFWLEMFPDPHSRPARHTFANPELPAPVLVQCEIMAVL